jgi:two-component system KDP operon response regulator KdpE
MPNSDRADRPWVLVVDDDRGIRDAVLSALSDVGITGLGAPDGSVALSACQRNDPDVVILDLAMPELDGAGFADAYRRMPDSHARLIVMSAADRGSETAARMRADAFFSKPFEINNLVALAERFLQESSVRRGPIEQIARQAAAEG